MNLPKKGGGQISIKGKGTPSKNMKRRKGRRKGEERCIERGGDESRGQGRGKVYMKKEGSSSLEAG